MTKVIARVHPVHLMNADERQVAANPQTKPIDLGCESAKNWQLPSTSTITNENNNNNNFCYATRLRVLFT